MYFIICSEKRLDQFDIGNFFLFNWIAVKKNRFLYSQVFHPSSHSLFQTFSIYLSLPLFVFSLSLVWYLYLSLFCSISSFLKLPLFVSFSFLLYFLDSFSFCFSLIISLLSYSSFLLPFDISFFVHFLSHMLSLSLFVCLFVTSLYFYRYFFVSLILSVFYLSLPFSTQ